MTPFTLLYCCYLQVKVTTVDGPVELKIPPGTQPGTTLLMAKRGVPRLGANNVRGNHNVSNLQALRGGAFRVRVLLLLLVLAYSSQLFWIRNCLVCQGV
jgi:hypothetical protein